MGLRIPAEIRSWWALCSGKCGGVCVVVSSGRMCQGRTAARTCEVKAVRTCSYILIFKMYEKYRLAGRTVQKLEMGAERPILTPHLRVYSPPQTC